MKNSTLTAKLTLLALIILFDIHSIHAQINIAGLDVLKNVIPPSPNAASLGKYTDWPVNLYTGVPSIDIPIYELKGRSTSIPISLSYHAAGIKVGETASSVGLGWSLNAGGIITRSVRGLPDDDYYTGYLVMRQAYANPGDLSSGTTPASTDSANTVGAATGQVDSEPDMFMLNAMGKSFKFFFAGNGSIVTQPYSNVRIAPSWSDSTWNVTLEDGTVLKFGKTGYLEITNNVRVSGNPAVANTAFISAWYLKSITTIDGETIDFTYTSSNITHNTFFSETDYIANNNNGSSHAGSGTDYASGLANCACNVGSYNGYQGTSRKVNRELQQVTSLNLASIQSDIGRVEFVNSSSTRTDLQGGYSLARIKIYNRLTSTYIKQYRFVYSYSSATSGNSVDNGTDSYSKYRLHLDSLDETSMDSTLHQRWAFNYNPTTLPARTSFAQDYLGFYNGYTSNQTLLPQILTSQALYNAGFGPPNYLTGNRSFNASTMQAEMLTKITYPTGGYTVLNFEPNSYPTNAEIFSNTTVNDGLHQALNQPNPYTNTKIDTFRITRPQFINVNSNASFSSSYTSDFGANTILAKVTVVGISAGNTTDGGIQSFKASTGSINTYYYLKDTGTYIVKMEIPNSDPSYFTTGSDYANVNASFTYQKSLGVQAINALVGGVRIHSQLDYDNVTSSKPSKQKWYRYTGEFLLNPVDTINAFLSTLSQQLKTTGSPDLGFPCTYDNSFCYQNYLIRNSASQEALGTIQGGPIGYRKVTVLDDSIGNNGYVISYFDSVLDLQTQYTQLYPYAAGTTVDWRRGLLKQQSTFTAGGKLLENLTNSYQFVNKTSIYGFKAGATRQDGQIQLSRANVQRVDERVLAEAVQKLVSTVAKYDQATTDSLKIVTNYYYDDTLNMQPVRTVYVDSKGDTVLTYSRTALEKSDINASITLSAGASLAADSMVKKNMVGQVLEQEQYRRNVLVNKSLVNYRLTNGNIPFKDNIMIKTGPYPIENRILFKRYDSKGNLTEQAKNGDLRHVYIYDYKSTYPVAECVGADSADVAYTSFESDGTGSWVISGGSVSSSTGITGTNYFNMATGVTISRSGLNSAKSYLVTYWSKSGALTISGATAVAGLTKSGWTFYQHTLPASATSVSISGGTNMIDELRLYPVDAQLTTYTYNPLIGVSAVCNATNLISYYEYDGLCRLARIRDLDNNILKQYDYKYVVSAQ